MAAVCLISFGVDNWYGGRKAFQGADRREQARSCEASAVGVQPTHESPLRANPRPEITIAAVGDVLLDQGVGLLIDNTSPTYPLRNVASILRSADITFANLENPLTDRGTPTPHKTPEALKQRKEWLFRGEPSSAALLQDAGIDVVSLANNHAMDYQRVGLRDTMTLLQKKRIAWCGAGENAREATTPALLEVNGTRLAFLAFAEGGTMPSPDKYEARDARPGLAMVYANADGSPTQTSLQRVRAALQTARGLADLVVVSYHWGIECTDEPTPFQRALGRNTVDFGADLVLGHHPHRLQAIERYKGKLIAYSLGNFLFNPRYEPQRETVIVRATFADSALASVDLIPVYIRDASPEVIPAAQATRRAHIAARLRATP